MILQKILYIFLVVSEYTLSLAIPYPTISQRYPSPQSLILSDNKLLFTLRSRSQGFVCSECYSNSHVFAEHD